MTRQPVTGSWILVEDRRLLGQRSRAMLLTQGNSISLSISILLQPFPLPILADSCETQMYRFICSQLVALKKNTELRETDSLLMINSKHAYSFLQGEEVQFYSKFFHYLNIIKKKIRNKSTLYLTSKAYKNVRDTWRIVFQHFLPYTNVFLRPPSKIKQFFETFGCGEWESQRNPT